MGLAAVPSLVQLAAQTLVVLASILAESAQGLLWLGLLSVCHPYNGNSMLTMENACETNHWQIIGLLLFIPCSNTFCWYCSTGAAFLMEGTVNANFGILSECKRIVKNQSFTSTTKMFQLAGIMVGDGIPGCKAPILSITALIFLRSWNNLHLPDFFSIRTQECCRNLSMAWYVLDLIVPELGFLGCLIFPFQEATEEPTWVGEWAISMLK